jgi:hypothetical protein
MANSDHPPVPFHEASEKLNGHRPVMTIRDLGQSKVVCTCDMNLKRPFMWHVLDVIYAPEEE